MVSASEYGPVSPSHADPSHMATDQRQLEQALDAGDPIDPADPFMGAQIPDVGAVERSRDPTTTYKYGATRTARWHWEHTYDHPRITEHAQERWDDHTPPDAVSIERAWLDSKRVKYLCECDDVTDRDGTTPDGLRLYAAPEGGGYVVVFLVQARPTACIRTVYPIEYFEESPVKSFLSALADQYPHR